MAKAKRAKHTSLAKEIRRPVHWVEQLPEVSKVVMGRHDACTHRYRKGCMRVVGFTDAGFRLRAYTGAGVQEIFVCVEPISAKEKVATVITERYFK